MGKIKFLINEEKEDMENRFFETNLVLDCGEITSLVYVGQ